MLGNMGILRDSGTKIDGLAAPEAVMSSSASLDATNDDEVRRLLVRRLEMRGLRLCSKAHLSKGI
jgi:hypothetical protein